MKTQLLLSTLLLIVVTSTCGVYAGQGSGTVIFSDDFEGYADQAALEAVWDYTGNPLVLNTEQNHTLGGAQSVWSDHSESGTAGDRYAGIEFSTDPIECSVEAWFYDTGASDTFGFVAVSPTSSPGVGAEGSVVEVGLFPWGGGGVTHYSYYDASGDWVRKNSGIEWDVGWHKVNIVFAESGGAIYLDDVPLVTDSPNLTAAKKLWLGNPWTGANPMYFDDVTIARPAADEVVYLHPEDDANGVSTTPTLSWLASISSVSYDVYFGTDFDNVQDATRTSSEFKGNQPETTYAPGPLTFGNMYYWRIDEVDASNNTYKGDVWKFLVSPTCDTFPEGDLNRDCVVDYKDLAAFAATWLDCTVNNGPCP